MPESLRTGPLRDEMARISTWTLEMQCKLVIFTSLREEDDLK
jgi:hypothetical protein